MVDPVKDYSKQHLAKLVERSCLACASQIDDLMDKRNLTVSYRPIAALADCSIYGHLAMAHGPIEAPVRSIHRLFAMAVRLGYQFKFAKRYFEAVLIDFALAGVPGRLLLSLPAHMDEEVGGNSDEVLAKALKKSGLEPHRVVIIHPGINSDQEAAVRNSLAFANAIRRQGVSLGAGSLACERSEQLLWNWIAPEIVLLDECQLRGANISRNRLDGLRHRVTEKPERQVLAQGISAMNELQAALSVGASLATGELIGKLGSRPVSTVSARSINRLNTVCLNAQSEPDDAYAGFLLGKLLVRVAPVTPEMTSDEVFRIFDQEPEQSAVAVVSDWVPLGLVSRYEMVNNLAKPFRHELYGKKSCTRFMDSEALCADIRIDLADLTDLVSNAAPRHLISGFIITDRGRYLGLGSVQDLMRELTAMQLVAARYANPLTQLPGNVPINTTIDQNLLAGARFTVCYCDLDHFKPLNDVFGYAKGDAIIVMTARILAEACDAELDFIGHVGGDDFVLIFRSLDWQARCERALARFEEESREMFPADVLAAGGYEAENRSGEREFFPLTCLSIGAAEIEPGVFENYLAVVAVVGEAKKKAKSLTGNSLFVNRRHYIGKGTPLNPAGLERT